MASSNSNSPCAACKFLRRKCLPGCIFAPYFPPEEPQKFANVHKIFGASNVTKLLNDLPTHQREDAVNSLAYEAEARIKDPVYGCVGAISVLQKQVHRLQEELDAANANLIRYAAACCSSESSPSTLILSTTISRSRSSMELNRSRMGVDHQLGGSSFYYIIDHDQSSAGLNIPYDLPPPPPPPWPENFSGVDHMHEMAGGGAAESNL